MGTSIPRSIFALALIAAAATVMLRTHLLESRIRSGQMEDRSADQLQSIISEIHFDGIPLIAAIDELARKSGRNIRVDWEAFPRRGQEKSDPVRVRLYDVSLAQALKIVFTEAGGPGTSEPRFVPLEGEILVTPFSDPQVQPVELRMYDVSDLANRFLSFGSASSSQYSWAAAQRMEGLTSVLEGLAPYDSGETEIFSFAGRLFISTRPSEHRRIAQVLHNLRKLQDARERGELLEPINGDQTLDFVAKNSAGSIVAEDPVSVGNAHLTRLYDVRDFADRFVGPVDMNANPLPKFIDSAVDHTMTRQDRIDALLFLIHRYADPDAWRGNDGNSSTMREADGFMTITQPPENQHTVALVLHNLRKLRAAVDRGENPATQPINLLQVP